MRGGTARRLATSLLGVAVAFTAVTMVLHVVNREPLFDALVIVAAATMGYATVGRLIASRHPQNPIGWLFLSSGVAFGIAAVTDAYVVRGVRIAPGSLPLVSLAAWIQNWIFVPAVTAIPLAVLLFPTGRLPSHRWRPAAWAIVGGAALAVTGLVIKPGQAGGTVTVENPTGIQGLGPLGSMLQLVAGLTIVAATVASVVAVILRFLRSRGQERQQLRWLVYTSAAAITVFALTWLAEAILGERGVAIGNVLFISFFLIATLGIPAATGVAIMRYRLYSLDVVIRKTVVFAVLATFITLAYVVVVVAIPVLVLGVGAGGREYLVPFVAAAVLALAFQPVRNWARRLANRLVYGKRATPYEVLVEFAEHAGSYSIEEVLPRMVEIVARGTGALRAAVWLRVADTLRREATFPSDQPAGWSASRAMEGAHLPPIPDADASIPVRHRGELLGAISVKMPAAEPLTPAHQKLLADVASQAGLVLRNVRLIEDLRASRKRLVAAQDEERRRLERDIHDGAQQQLVALAVRLNMAHSIASKKAPDVADLLEGIKRETQEALENLRDLARGIYPPLLADKGLPVALEAQARKSPIRVTVEPDGVGRYPAEAEAAVYFCVLEALQNAAKYAQASRVEVRLEAADGELRFEVADDGGGFDPATTPPGSGLQNMRDRLEALGGTVTVISAPGGGTRISGAVPARPLMGSP